MNILTISKLKKEFSGEVLFSNVSFDINSSDKIALIGKNGSGKSTLIKMIMELESVDDGNIYKNKQATIGYLSQQVLENIENTLIEEMNLVFTELFRLEELLNNIAKKLNAAPHDNKLLEQYSNIQHKFDLLGGYDFHYRIDSILYQFGFDKSQYDRKIETFSGGEKTRIAFAKLLLKKPDLLILDEPTNHLDISIIDWLEEHLIRYDGAVLVVTHDKYFIDRVCKKIIEIDHKTTHLYYGTFVQYQEEKLKRYELLLKHYVHQQKEIAHLQSFVDRFRYNAKRASLAKDRIKKISRIDKMEKPTTLNRKILLEFESRNPTKEVILVAKNISIGYPNNVLVEHLTFSMRGFDKLAVIGPNGVGKTTLIQALRKRNHILSGKIEFLRDYKIGYFDQNQETLHTHKSIFQEIHDAHPNFTNYEVRKSAARFLFIGEDLDKKISVLSGGEKVRLVLLLLMLKKPEILILDEPTNHLDMETRDIVEDVLEQFSGPVIFVSHDRYFINRVASKIVYLNKNMTTEFDGNYDDFKEWLKMSDEKLAKKRNKSKKSFGVNKNPQKSLKELEQQIYSVEQEIDNLIKSTYLPENYKDSTKMHKIDMNIEIQKNKLHKLETEYFKILEQIENQGEHE
jgi:ATP-binding cassette subfamily F protein 3